MTKTQEKVLKVLHDILASKEFDNSIEQAIRENIWFTRENIQLAVSAIRDQILQPDKVNQWLSNYDIRDLRPKNVGIVMAGNIPLVGFFDLFCVIITGNNAIVKPSSKDSAMICCIVDGLRNEGFNIHVVSEIPLDIEAIIATGGEESSKYFTQRFSHIPHLIRGDRHSVALITGDETPDQLNSLVDDMFQYWGLGCRNVNHLFLPRGYELSRIPKFATNFAPFHDNYRQRKAIYTMIGQQFVDQGSYLLIENLYQPPLSVIGYTFYDHISDIQLPENQIQCLITNDKIDFPRKVNFGQSQYPFLMDYPDSKDIVKFLRNQ